MVFRFLETPGSFWPGVLDQLPGTKKVFQLFLGVGTQLVLGFFDSINVENQKYRAPQNALLGGGFNHFLFSPLLGEDSHFD